MQRQAGFVQSHSVLLVEEIWEKINILVKNTPPTP